MKLKYELTVMDMGGELAAVPTGKNAADFHGIIKINETAKIILEQLKEDTTPQKIAAYLKKEYPASTEEEIKNALSAFLEQLNAQGLLISL